MMMVAQPLKILKNTEMYTLFKVANFMLYESYLNFLNYKKKKKEINVNGDRCQGRKAVAEPKRFRLSSLNPLRAQ